jgi:hypothetical protein
MSLPHALKNTRLALAALGALAAPGAPAPCSKVPHDQGCFTQILDAPMPEYLKDGLSWPLEREIQLRKASGADPRVQRCIRSTLRWLGLLLRPEVLPDPSRIEVLALHPGPEGAEEIRHDTIRLRYRLDPVLFQITANSRDLIIVIQDARKAAQPSLAADASCRAVASTLATYFNHAERVQPACRWKTRPARQGMEGLTTNCPTAWWESVSWWTDGETFLFRILKVEPGLPRMPSFVPGWFTAPAAE